MSRQLTAIAVAISLIFGSISTSAFSAPAVPGTGTEIMQTSSTAGTVGNTSPLPPGGAAGIKQAQGYTIEPWLAVGIVAAIFIIGVLLLDDDDDDDGPITTGT